jgi:hypothetical protein
MNNRLHRALPYAIARKAFSLRLMKIDITKKYVVSKAPFRGLGVNKQMAKLFFSNRIHKIVVDTLLLSGFVCLFFTMGKEPEFYAMGIHCVVGAAWTVLMLIHVYQHWHLVKAFTKKKVILKNKITALTIFAFILMLISIIWFTININDVSVGFHNFAHLFPVILIIHVVQKWERYISLFKKKITK